MVAPLEEENLVVDPVRTEVPVEQTVDKVEEKIEEAPEPEVTLEAQREDPKPTQMEVMPEEYVAPHDVTEQHAAIPAVIDGLRTRVREGSRFMAGLGAAQPGGACKAPKAAVVKAVAAQKYFNRK